MMTYHSDPALAGHTEVKARHDAPPWDTLVRRRDDGDVAGWHDCLDGLAVYHGMSLELKLVDLPAGVPVRYERCGVSGEYVVLYANIGGHQFTCLAEPWMRFRWPAAQVPSAP